MTAGEKRRAVIAIDGPSASGKGTLARRLAERYGFALLDTGALYRAVAIALLRQGDDPDDAQAATAAAQSLDPASLDDPELRSGAVGEAASRVAAHSDVRLALRDFQRNFAERPPGGEAGAVLDGRDIGTVICPDADVKLFVTASVRERARRRLKDLQAQGEAVEYDDVLAAVRKRDERDESRADAPMKPAQDAHLLDTTDLSIEAALAEAIRIVKDEIGPPPY